jgi:hypothetical protein
LSRPSSGIKARGGKAGIEDKGLVAQLQDTVRDGPLKAPTELWTKWTSNVLAVPANLKTSTKKTRWLGKFDTTGSMLDGARAQTVPPPELRSRSSGAAQRDNHAGTISRHLSTIIDERIELSAKAGGVFAPFARAAKVTLEVAPGPAPAGSNPLRH